MCSNTFKTQTEVLQHVANAHGKRDISEDSESIAGSISSDSMDEDACFAQFIDNGCFIAAKGGANHQLS